jgi:putative PEP-CTERM system TPR-repeat lipoprotein
MKPERTIRPLFLALAAGASLWLCGCGADSPAAYLASGKEYLAKQDYTAAAIEFKNAVRAAPNDGEARYLLGSSLQRAGDLGGAEIELQKAAAAGYAPERVRPALARTLIMRGAFDKALAEADDEAITDAAAKAELQALRGEALLGLGRVDEASAAFKQALGVHAVDETAQLGLARVAAARSDLAGAQAAVDGALQRAPTSLAALLLKADLLAAERRTQEAAQAYERAIALQPGNQRAHLGLVPLLLRQGQAAKARERVNALKAGAPRAFATQYLDALVSYSENQPDAAHEAVQQALRMAPEHVPSLLLAGAVAHDSGRYALAEQHLLKVVDSAPDYPYPRRLLISTYLRTGQAQRAEEALQPLLKTQPQDAAVLRLAGEVALALGEVQEAAQHFESASRRDPKNVATRLRLSRAHLAAGETERAIADLEAAAQVDKDNYRADVALVALHLNRRQPDKALAAAQALERKQPDNPLTHNLMGLVLVEKKDGAQARTRFERALQLEPSYFAAAHNLAQLDRREGKPDAARQRYQAILARDARHEQALLALAQLLQQTGAQPAEVQSLIERAVAGNPSSARAHLFAIGYWLRTGEPKRALSAAQRAQAALPENTAVLQALGRAQLAAGDANQAIATFGRLAALMPEAPGPLLGQADAFAAAKDWRSARAALGKALELQPGLMAARRALALTALRLENSEQASADARETQARWPDRPEGYLTEVEVLEAQGKTAEAEALIRKTLAKFPQSPVLVAAYTILQRQGRKQAAESLALEWVKDHPKDAQVPSFFGQTALAERDFAAAARWYQAALSAQPDDAAALNNVAWALGQLKDPAALDYAQRAVKLAPDNPAMLDTLGWLQVQQGRIEPGLRLLEQAHALAPGSAPIRLNLAKALLQAGQRAQARSHLQALSALPARSPVRTEAEQLLAVN